MNSRCLVSANFCGRFVSVRITLSVGEGKIPTLKGNSTYDTPTYVASVKTLNAIIDSLPAWWDANNPSNTGKVTIADTLKAFGGESPLENVFVGQVAGTFTDYHPGAKGQAIMGETFAQAVVNVLE